ncbi:hypothetical protein [Nonomuraea soli]|uniref:Uncharacterized protein n=1 Tax=Nonomuraea soli TaxID=1032476 RepID=A0A7W0HU71_9ACTN|nr:hypothetical protein [Nonomuraea soli]MBA2895780.1 hypothetical protein [Nonomuraea soli]
MSTFGSGTAVIDSVSGAPVQFLDPEHPRRRYLLDAETTPWHSAEHQWGSGHLVTTAGARRWHLPVTLEADAVGRSRARYGTAAGVEVAVEREYGRLLTERYTFTNRTPGPLAITGLGIQTPFRDLYEDAETSLAAAVHAHVFTGGTWAWVLAQPMSGDGRCLGLIVREGALHAYTIESRNQNTSSNARGHIVLHVTDLAGNPAAFGGQAAIHLEAGESYTLAWELGWYDGVEEFLAATRPPARLPRLAAPVGTPIEVATTAAVAAPGVEVTTEAVAARGVEVTTAAVVSPGVEVTTAAVAARGPEVAGGTGVCLNATTPGLYRVDIGSARTEVLFHLPVDELVRRRAAYIVRHHRPTERPGTLAHAFVPVDTRTGLTQTGNGWSDWSDGSERICMPMLLHQARRHGRLAADVADPLLEGWAAFAREHLLLPDASPRRGSSDTTGVRLYDAPWLARAFLDHHLAYGRQEDLELAAAILERAFDLGIGHFLAIGLPEACLAIATALDAADRAPGTPDAADQAHGTPDAAERAPGTPDAAERAPGTLDAADRAQDARGAAGRASRAEALRERLVASAEHFVALGERLPAHEVHYEQSIVAPLVRLVSDAHTVTGDPRFAKAAAERLPWLLAFGGPQPHVRLRHVAIRHWDGYWFGHTRLWGDVFPHHWSTLTADALYRLPPELRTERTDAVAREILRANLANLRPDGSATCAFVMPSTVDGRPAHREDPLANDQDWHLVLWLRLADELGVPLD